MDQEAHPRVVEVQEDQMDPRRLALWPLHTSVATLLLPASHLVPNWEGRLQDEAPNLKAPWGPSLVVVLVIPKNQVVEVHVVPRNQVAVVHEVPSHQEGVPSPHGGPSSGQDPQAPCKDVHDLNSSLSCVSLLQEANTA